MSSPIKNVIIAGAAGNLGALALQSFLNTPLNVSVLTREDSTSTFPPNVHVVKTNYTKDNLVAALKGQDAVVSFISHTAPAEAQNTLIDAAAEAGVKRFIPSEFGHNTGNDKVRSVLPIFSSKRSFIERIQSHPNLTWTGVIAGLFFDWGFKHGFLGVDLKNGKATIWDDGSVPFSTTNLKLIGKTIVKLLTDPAAYEDSKNKYIFTASHTTTQAELVAIAEKVTGKKFEVTKLNSAQVLAENKEKLAKGDFSAIPFLIQGVAFAKNDGEALTDFRPLGIFNEKYGIKDVSVEQDIRSFAESQ